MDDKFVDISDAYIKENVEYDGYHDVWVMKDYNGNDLVVLLRKLFPFMECDEDPTLRSLINRIDSVCNLPDYKPKTDSRMGDCMGLVNVFMHSREQAAMIRALELAKIRTLSRYGVAAVYDELDVMVAEIKAGM